MRSPSSPEIPRTARFQGRCAIDISEKNFEATIEAALLSQGYRKRESRHFDPEFCVDEEVLVEFLRATQGETWDKLKEQYPGGTHRPRLVKHLAKEIAARGTVDVLRNGLSDRGCHFVLAHQRPESSLNPDHAELHRANQFTVLRQVRYRTREGAAADGLDGALDMVLCLNGLPLVTVELKVAPATVREAEEQYKTRRDAREPLFAFGRCLAHVAMDTDRVRLTTRLDGRKSDFLHFNQGHGGGGGNPPPRGGVYAVAYMWNVIWAPDSLLELVFRFVHLEGVEKTGARRVLRKTSKQIFPRHHQREAVRTLVGRARREGAGQCYLVQHSAGSGKSNTIAWLAHRLSSLHDDADRPVFHTVLVITDRKVLDRQLQGTVASFEKQPGVVVKIDKDSRQLGEAIEAGKKIIITTLQKFSMIDESVRARPDRRFAVIVDEAHSSQSGEGSKSVKKVLSWATLEAAAEAEGKAPETLEDHITAEMQGRARVPNLSLFAFTATPKKKTLEIFGERQPDGSFAPHSLYSMRQAIEEGFILDVLENYTTYRSYWRLLKTIEDDPQVEQSKAKGLLKRLVELGEHAIDAKIAVLVDHFESAVRHRIDGEAKAMIVCRSRLHAVHCIRALRRELAERGLPHKSLVAFSDTVASPDGQQPRESWTEASLNGIPESQTQDTFARPEFRFLVVAEKFQTGFDQPLLHTMYVDKKLSGVHAVQTLSRLNRILPGRKHETQVLDFANTTEEIREAFSEYYEKTILSEETDPNLLYKLRDSLADFALYGPLEIDGFAEIYFRRDTARSPAARRTAIDRRHAEALACLDPVLARYRAVEDIDDRRAFRRELRRFTRLYGFLSQVISFVDAELEKLYVFAVFLLRRLPSEAGEPPLELVDAVDTETFRLHKTSEGKINLPGGTTRLDPDGIGEGRLPEDPLRPLSKIVEELNRLYGMAANGTAEDILRNVEQRLAEDPGLEAGMRANTPDNAALTFKSRASDLLLDIFDETSRFSRLLNDDPRAEGLVLAELLQRYTWHHERLRKLIEEGENAAVEFKSSLRYSLRDGEHNARIVTHAALKTIAAFLNTHGGDLLLGVADDGSIVGIEVDGFDTNDAFLLHLKNVVQAGLGDRAGTCLDSRCQVLESKIVCLVRCGKSPEPILLSWRNTERSPLGDFYVRQGPSSDRLAPESARRYILTRFGEAALEASPLGVSEEAASAASPKGKAEPSPSTVLDAERLFRRVASPSEAERFQTCLPLVELEAAAGAFSDAQDLGHGALDEASEWVELLDPPAKARRLAPGMFVARVRGRSMEPRIADGAYCVFRGPVTGSRQGRPVLAQLRGVADPEHGGGYTVKIYTSTKHAAKGDGWRHAGIVLRPVNREFAEIVLEEGMEVRVVAELVAVLGTA